MKRPKFQFASHISPKPPSEEERGYILLVLLLFATVIAIGLMRVLPSFVVQSQREKEDELQFRGQQYRHAIQLFVRKFGRYPNSLSELENTNRIRFLRRQYRDPMTKDGEWRLIHIGPGGVFFDAQTTIKPPNQNAQSTSSATSGATSSTGQDLSQSSSSSTAGAINPSANSTQQSSNAGSGSPTSVFQSGATATQPSQQPTTSPFASGAQAFQQPGSTVSPFGQAGQPSANPTANPQQQPRAASGPQINSVTGIAGVASRSTAASVKVWNGYSQHNEWEFVYDFRADPVGQVALMGASGVAVVPPTAATGASSNVPTTPPQQPTTTTSPFSPFQSPGGLGSGAPGIRPGIPTLPGQFPPSPIPQPTNPAQSK